MKVRKGIILAGGLGTRLHPITLSLSKHLLPIYDKPMIYYPLSVLMLAGIREVAIITNPHHKINYHTLLKDGSQWGMKFTFIEQATPDGIAQAYLLAEGFLDGAPSALILGDNIFYGNSLGNDLKQASIKLVGGSVFGYHVSDPQRYGVVGFDKNGNLKSIEEKPKSPDSNYALTGLYFLDGTAPDKAKQVLPSARGELEITTLLNIYLNEGSLGFHKMGRGFTWLDTGTYESLLMAGEFVRTIQKRMGLLVGSPDEIAFGNNWISRSDLEKIVSELKTNEYRDHLVKLTRSD